MVELSVLVYLLAGFFAYVGYLRGWTKELIALSGVILSLFALFEFDNLIRVTLFGELPPAQVFYVQTTIFIVIVFFAYQTRALNERAGRRGENREEAQSRVLGAIVGATNGYLIGGTIWYFMDISNYPLAPQVIAPRAGFSSASMIDNLPLYMLTSGGEGTLLSLLVVVLFVIVLVLI
ncbi:MAG: CvpA family protein [Anaerolineae bacterium]|nr:CvpA family protein [Anaerolineae bacterium]MDQ7034357.1 CvpA family protein [Anaerolineae bacterium]